MGCDLCGGRVIYRLRRYDMFHTIYPADMICSAKRNVKENFRLRKFTDLIHVRKANISHRRYIVFIYRIRGANISCLPYYAFLLTILVSASPDSMSIYRTKSETLLSSLRFVQMRSVSSSIEQSGRVRVFGSPSKEGRGSPSEL